MEGMLLKFPSSWRAGARPRALGHAAGAFLRLFCFRRGRIVRRIFEFSPRSSSSSSSSCAVSNEESGKKLQRKTQLLKKEAKDLPPLLLVLLFFLSEDPLLGRREITLERPIKPLTHEGRPSAVSGPAVPSFSRPRPRVRVCRPCPPHSDTGANVPWTALPLF